MPRMILKKRPEKIPVVFLDRGVCLRFLKDTDFHEKTISCGDGHLEMRVAYVEVEKTVIRSIEVD